MEFNKVLAIDLNEILYQSVFVARVLNAKNTKGFKLPFMFFVIRKIFTVIKKYPNRQIFGLVDGRSPWRKKLYSRYKEGREKLRKSYTDINWEYVWQSYTILSEHLEKFTPITVLRGESLESDDWASFLSRCSKDIVLCSSDEDLHQLCYYPQVILVSLRDKKLLPKNIERPLQELNNKIIHGCKSDKVPPAKTEEQKELNKQLVTLIYLPKEIDDLMYTIITSIPPKVIKQEELDEFCVRYTYKFIKNEITNIFGESK